MSKTAQIGLTKTSLFVGGQSLIEIFVKSPVEPIGSVLAALSYPANLIKIKEISAGDKEFSEPPIVNLTTVGAARFLIQNLESLVSPTGLFIVARLLVNVIGEAKEVVNINFGEVSLSDMSGYSLEDVQRIHFKTKIKS